MDAFSDAPGRAIVRLRLEDIKPNPAQPRRRFPDESLDSLAESISEHGLLSPLLVRRIDAGKYELVAGERRMRALMRLGLKIADAIIITAYDTDSALIALIENIQREQLHYLDEAEACRQILDEHHVTREELARKLGKSPSALANRLRLIRLSPQVKDMLIQTGLSERHARALLMLDDAAVQLRLIAECSEKSLTVRQLEQKIARISVPRPKRGMKHAFRDLRLYVNAVIDTVDKLNTMGAHAEAKVGETDEGTVITILLRTPNT